MFGSALSIIHPSAVQEVKVLISTIEAYVCRKKDKGDKKGIDERTIVAFLSDGFRDKGTCDGFCYAYKKSKKSKQERGKDL